MKIINKISIIVIILLLISLGFVTYFYFYWKNGCISTINNYTNLVKGLEEINDGLSQNTQKVRIEIQANSITPEGATIIISDENEIPYLWKENYTLMKKVDNNWENVPSLIEMNFSKSPYLKKENDKITQVLDWNSYYGKLSAGIYKVVKNIYTYYDLSIDSEEFEIK